MLRQSVLASRAGTISLSYRTLRYAASTSKPTPKDSQSPPYPPPLITIEKGTFFRSYPSSEGVDPTNPPLLTKLDFTLGARHAEPRLSTKVDSSESQSIAHKKGKSGEGDGPLHWAVIGPGSTTFLNILRGQYIAVPPTSRSYPYLSSDQFLPKDTKLRHPSNAIQYVGFSGEGSQATGGTRGAYLSARYESLREETDWTVLQYLKGQTELNPLESEESVQLSDEAFFQEVVGNLKLRDLLNMPVSNLSNGQTRRTRIAKSLLAKPELLLLDEPFMGLDPATTDSISSLLRNLAEQSSPRVLLSLRPQDSIPDWITNVLVIAGDEVAYSGKKEDFLNAVGKIYEQPIVDSKDGQDLNSLFAPGGIFSHQTSGLSHAESSALSGSGRRRGLTRRTPIVLDGEPIIEMDGVHVQYGDKVVIGGWQQDVLDGDNRKQGLQWKVRRGQRWAVLGANGSGKTTLLSVITSDHPQAYALPVRMFGHSRLPEPGKPAISIFDLQSRIGHSSPEIHAFFPRQLTVRASIESAWADTFLAKPVLTYEIDVLIDRVLEHFRPELDPRPEDVKEEIDLSFMPEQFQKKILSAENSDRRRNKTSTVGPDFSTQYAESLTFGQLSIAQQRLVLFIRAIIKKQDLIILDEAFSGMPASMREKCFALLNNTPPKTKKAEDSSQPQLPYLGPEQSILVVSHLREEIPDCVRFFMRLPSEVGDGKKLQFALGVVPDGIKLSTDQDVWKTIWSENSLIRSQMKSSSEGEGVLNDVKKYRYVVPRASK